MNNKPMYVQLLGVGLPNRGAELMARTIIEKFDAKYSNCIYCIDQKIPESDRENLSLKKLRPYVVRPFFSRPFFSKPFLSRPFKSGKYKKPAKDCPLINQEKVDVVIDISGFAYGDFWKSPKAKKRLFDLLPLWRAKKTPLFIMPQALGPFSDPDFQTYLKPCFDYAKIVCPRDQQSLAYAKEIGGVDFTLSSDITFSLQEGHDPRPEDCKEEYSLIIPNSKIIASGTLDKGSYIQLVIAVIKKFSSLGKTVYMLNHEGENDLKLCLEIGELTNVETINPIDAIEIKQRIAGAELVFTSRFHGLISSLATGTPPIVFGWSHKYKEVLKEFGLSRHLIQNHSNESLQLIDDLYDQNYRETVRLKIEARNKEVQTQLDELWLDVFSNI